MLIIFMLFSGLFLIFLFGYKLSGILLPDAEKPEQISLGYISGIGIFTFIWFLLNWAGIPYNLMSGFILLLSLSVVLFAVDRFFGKVKRKGSIIDLSYFKKLNTIEIVLLITILFLCISTLIQDIFWPVRYWDSLMLYDFRAKIFAMTGSLQSVIADSYFFGYPFLTSLVHTWVYLLGGTNPSFIYSILYICLLINFFFNFKKLNIGRTTVLFLTAMVAVSPRLFDHTQWAYTNLPYSIYIILGSIYLYTGVKNKDFGAYTISAILIGLSTWTRSAEPFWLSYVVMAAVASVFIKKWLWPFIYIALVGSIMLPWRAFQAIHNEGSVNVVTQVVSTSQGVVQNLQMSVLKPTFDFVMTNVVGVYLVYFILLGAIILIKLFMKSKEWFFTFLIIINLALVFAGTMMFVKYVTYYQDIPDSLARMVMFIPPLIIFLSAELLSELKTRKNN